MIIDWIIENNTICRICIYCEPAKFDENILYCVSSGHKSYINIPPQYKEECEYYKEDWVKVIKYGNKR